MTHPTNEELDALQAKLRKGDQMDGKTVNCKHDQCNCALLCDADDTITALRTQLAAANTRADRAEAALADADAMIEAQAKDHAENNIRLAEMSHRVSQLEGMVMSGQGEQVRLAADLLQAKIECSEANACAARAAQIEVDAGIADALATEWWGNYKTITHEHSYSQHREGMSDGADEIAAAIRAQPHDRTALDRMLAEAREKALREAAEMVSGSAYTSSNAGRRLEPVSPAMAGMDMHHATIADAILALIEKPNAT